MKLPHRDIVRTILEFEHSGYNVAISERRMDGRLFPYCYVFDSKENDTCIGSNFRGDLSDLSICVPKIKEQIDKDIADRIRWADEALQRKKELNWTGQKFNRGDHVHFKGNENYKPVDTYVWAYFGHMMMEYYLIQHNDGEDRSNWMAKPPFQDRDGFECVHSSQLKEGLKYIQIDCSGEFHGETDELVLLKSAEHAEV